MEGLLAVLVSSEAILGWILAGIAFVFGLIRRQGALKDSRIQKALLFLEQGVHETWEEGVKALKKKAADGKLTTEERKQAFETAKRKAIDYAKREGWDLLQYVVEASLPAIIRSMVENRKNRAG